ncbi:MAG: hypothetical protein IPH80_22845 [Myxococcales bacterium]|nr:hypothetical protein [Myxococcales bacterium]
MNLWEPILAMIMALTSFTIKPNPKAPAADAALAYAVDDADLVVHVDLQPTVIDNYPTWQKLADDPLIKQNAELAAGLRTAQTQVEGGRAMIKNLIGIDLTSDLTSLTAFARMRGAGVPDFVVVVRGKFAADLPQRLVQPMGGKPETIDGRVAGATPDGMLIGLTKDGTLLAGQRDLIAPRLADAWKPAPRAKGSAWAQIATVLDQRPFFALASKPSAAAATALAAQVNASFGRDLIAQHTLAIVSASATGVGWVYQAKDAAFAARIKLASEGWIELMRAAHVAPRGLVELAVAALPSYAGTSPELDDAIKHKDQILAAVNELTGDGKFTATVTQKGALVTVTTKGRRLSDVLPVGVVVGLGALGSMAFTKQSGAVSGPAGVYAPARPPARPSTPKPTPRPAPRPAPTPAPTR